ncbi:hypothetical protein QFC24_002422 [Naganishia onofrii]|uniref:Uncharacterized protein n=1 Tax=Naganishia onofrii TaxID=1851511 RepID=A0ACC2XS12_9TREE|nr:hypothetical protein QFC24_002422 [Naganishia onofrii]
MTYLALTEGVDNARAKFELDMCTYFTADTIVPNPFTQATSALRLVFAGALALATDAPRVKSEPALRPYVCAAGDATNCSK